MTFPRKRGRKSRCPYCGSSKTIAKGHRKTLTMGRRPRRFCKSCTRGFTRGRRPEVIEPIAATVPAVSEVTPDIDPTSSELVSQDTPDPDNNNPYTTL